jgi:hypothetical protein
MSLIFKTDACSLVKSVTTWLSFKNLLTRQLMVVHLFFALTVFIKWRFLFPTLCWSINTKSMVYTDMLSVSAAQLSMCYCTDLFEREAGGLSTAHLGHGHAFAVDTLDGDGREAAQRVGAQ